MLVGMGLGIPFLPGVLRGGAGPAVTSSELIQWLTAGAAGVTFSQVKDDLAEIVTDLPDYVGCNCTKFDGVGDCATGGFTPQVLDLTDGVSFTAVINNLSGTVYPLGLIGSDPGEYLDIQYNFSISRLFLFIGDGTSTFHESWALSGIDISEAHTYEFKLVGGNMHLYVDGVDIESEPCPISTIPVETLWLGCFVSQGHLEGLMSNVKFTGKVFPMADAASGSFTSLDGNSSIPITSTSGTRVMQHRDDGMPAIGAMYGGNRYLNCDDDSYTVLDTIPAQTFGDYSHIIIETTIKNPIGTGDAFFAAVKEIHRRLGMRYNGLMCIGTGSGLPATDGTYDYRDGKYYTVKGEWIHRAVDPRTILTIDGVEVVNDGGDMYYLNQEMPLSVGAMSNGGGMWEGSVGSKIRFYIKNTTTDIVLCDYTYELSADGSWTNQQTGQKFLVTAGADTTFIIPQDPVNTTVDIGGMPCGNDPALLNKLSESLSQTDALYENVVCLYNPTGLAIEDLNTYRARRHVTGDHQGCFGAWIDIDATRKQTYEIEQFELANKLTPAEVNALEIKYGCVGTSGAQRTGGVLDEDATGFCIFPPYTIT